MRKWKGRFYPTIDSPISARRAVDRAVKITSLWTFVNIALGLVMIFSGTKVTDSYRQTRALSGVAFLAPGILFGLIAWRIRCMSRGWTLGGLILASFLLLTDFAATPSPFALIVHAVVLVYFINALRAVISHDRLVADQSIADSLGAL
jgi:hypothetical protein